MRRHPRIVGLTAALAALGGTAAAPPATEPVHPNGARPGLDAGRPDLEAAVPEQPARVELMSFMVHVASDGMMFPQHGSHSSHSSHASHASHVSGGIPGGWNPPNLPDPPYYPPAPPPSSVPTTSPTPAPAPAAGPDIAYAACVRAFGGMEVPTISTELQKLFGVSEDVATDAANQASAAFAAGGHYCDGYHLG